MFRCEKCGRITKPNEKQYKQIVQTREKTYKNEDKYGNIKTSKGTEIVKEIKISEKCFERILGGKEKWQIKMK